MHSLITFVLATILALALAPAPQSQKKSQPYEREECGTIVPPGQFEAELARKAGPARKTSPALAIASLTDASYYLPLTIHMVHDKFGWLGLTPEQLEVAMQNLNRMWRPVGIQFFIYGEVDNSINDDDMAFPTTPEKRDALRRVNVVPNTINVYFTNPGPAGQSSFTKDPVQGVLLSYAFVDGVDGYDGRIFGLEVFAHEMGHYFDLYHTHETWKDSNGDPTKVECPGGDNCSTAGDLLCDTPADPGLNQPGFVDAATCAYIGTATTPTTCDQSISYNPLTNNL